MYLSSSSARIVSSLMGKILPTSCEVRKPSKKCMKGIRDSSVAICATSAISATSCTELEASIAQPVERQAITSEWSPKIDSACVASVLAVTCIVAGVSSPAILYIRSEEHTSELQSLRHLVCRL